MVKAPEGEHVSTSGIQFILDKDSKITGLKYPDEKGEGDADLAVEDKSDVVIEKKGDKADEGAFASKEDEMDARTDAEEEGYLDGIKDEKQDLINAGGFKLEDVIEVIGEVVEAKVEELKDKMKVMDDKMKSMEEKMSSFSSEPAADKTVPAIKFSKAEGTTKADKRYNAMLKRMSNK